MKALVVGGTGFLGMNVIRALVSAGHEVAATRRTHANTLFARKLGARMVMAELDDEDGLTEVMRGRDVVFMCAGHYPRFSLRRDEEIAIARRRASISLRAAMRAGVSRYVLTSSVSTVGPPNRPRTLSCEDDSMSRGAFKSVYFATKHAVEAEALAAVKRGLDVVTLCPTGVVGELDVKVGTSFFLVGLATGKLRVYVDGRINIVDASSVGHAHVLAAERGRKGERYIVGGHNLTIGELFRIAADELSVTTLPRRIPAWLATPWSSIDEWRCARREPKGRPLIAREFVDMARYGQWVDTTRATRELGLPTPPSLRDTLRTAIAWYVKFRYITSPAVAAFPSTSTAPSRPLASSVTHDGGPAASLGEKV